jgi:hypothetical protein
MSRKSVLSRRAGPPACDACGEDITDDVVRVEEGRVYHVRCYHESIRGQERSLYECPKCHTFGGVWSRRGREWRICNLCMGSGYLVPPDDRLPAFTS